MDSDERDSEGPADAAADTAAPAPAEAAPVPAEPQAESDDWSSLIALYEALAAQPAAY